MTDIVIKPSNSGGSVKLQTEGGTNGLTMASTGVLTTSGNVAVTGTVTGGTLGSGVTFPAGHVLKVTHDTTSETNTMTQSFVNYHELSFTLTSSSSDLYFIFTYEAHTGGSNEGHGLKVYRNNSATVTTSHTLVHNVNPTNSSGTLPMTGYHLSGSAHYSSYTDNFKDSLSGFSAGDTLYYGFFFRRRSNNNVVKIPPDEDQDGAFLTTITEVQK